jgi:hypothetical protein
MNIARGVVVTALIVSSIGACGGDASNDVRGRGMAIAQLSPAAQAAVYDAAARGAFDVNDPALSLLLDARLLPRTIGLASSGRLPESVTEEMHRRGTIKGTCEPALDGGRGTPRCSADLPGYVVRFSPVFTLRGDSTQVYIYAQKYDTKGSGNSPPLRFERAYQVVRRGDGWRAVREGRIPKEIRGETK